MRGGERFCGRWPEPDLEGHYRLDDFRSLLLYMALRNRAPRAARRRLRLFGGCRLFGFVAATGRFSARIDIDSALGGDDQRQSRGGGNYLWFRDAVSHSRTQDALLGLLGRDITGQAIAASSAAG